MDWCHSYFESFDFGNGSGDLLNWYQKFWSRQSKPLDYTYLCVFLVVCILLCMYAGCTNILTHKLHTGCTGSQSCGVCSRDVWSVLVEETWIGVRRPGKKHPERNLSSLATIAIPHGVTGDQTQDAVMETQCGTDLPKNKTKYPNINKTL